MTTLGNLGIEFSPVEIVIIAGAIRRDESDDARPEPTMAALRHFTAAYAVRCLRREIPMMPDRAFEVATLLVSRIAGAQRRIELASGSEGGSHAE